MKFWVKFIIFLFCSNILSASVTDEILKKLNKKNNIIFEFEQIINNQTENGQCVIAFPGKLKCIYDDKDGKEILVKNKSLYVIKHKFKRSYRYPVKKSAFNIILDKEKIFKNLKLINNTDIKETANEYFYEIKENDGLYIKIFFNKNSKMLKGWETISFNQEPVKFIIINPKINSIIEEKFILPEYKY